MYQDAEHEDLTKLERVCEELRDLQWQTNCSSKTLQTLLDALRGKLGRLIKESGDLPSTVTHADKKMQRLLLICLLMQCLIVCKCKLLCAKQQQISNTGWGKGCIFTWMCRLPQQSLGTRGL